MIIHFWELPEKRTYVTINNKLKDNLFRNISSRPLIRRLKGDKLPISFIKDISKLTGISLGIFEKNISWIGGRNSNGVSTPHLPFNFGTRAGARFVAAITNDGSLCKDGKESYGRLLYDNFDKTLRDSVMHDYLEIFGGKSAEVSFRTYTKKKYFEFASVIRDVVFLILKEKGSKAESNLALPSFILNDPRLMCGWIEQTIADEGEVKYEPSKYRRSIVWRRSLDVSSLFFKAPAKEIPFGELPINLQTALRGKVCKLIESEKQILNFLGISFNLYNLGIYSTVKGKVRTRWQISITKRLNLLKLRKLIKIPSYVKDQKFNRICNEFQRFKEPLRVKKAVEDLGKTHTIITSIDLQKKMNYKLSNTALVWLKKFEKEDVVKKVRDSQYGNGHYRRPAEYILRN